MAAPVDAEKFLARGLQAMGFVLENEAAVLARLASYFGELQKWNKRVNLVARTLDDEQILENHFLDSLSLLSILDNAQNSLLDVGTGAGFPGLVLKAACPELGVTCYDDGLLRVCDYFRMLCVTATIDAVREFELR